MELQYYLNAYGFLILGIFLVLFNLPVMVVVCRSKKLRNQYGVLITGLLNGFLSGVVSGGYGIFRLVLFAMGRDDVMITVTECFYNPLTFLLIWTFPMTGLGLLLNSIDRLIVINFPLSYFRFNVKVVVLLNIIAVILNSGIVFVTCYFTIQTRSTVTIDVFCTHYDLFSPSMYVFLAAVRAFLAVLAVLLMFFVLVVFVKQNRIRTKQAFHTDETMKRHYDLFSPSMYVFLAAVRAFLAVLAVLLMFFVLVVFVKQNRIRTKQAFHTDETMKRFTTRQMDYTKTMLISCIATIGRIQASMGNLLRKELF
uniref:G_PROTEIN_RECEP_F1_2 domain-containing protein n=1 Tax=Steinernema glaseri TaxID=37863 RepID=A0A1I7ZVV0_9BILA